MILGDFREQTFCFLERQSRQAALTRTEREFCCRGICPATGTRNCLGRASVPGQPVVIVDVVLLGPCVGEYSQHKISLPNPVCCGRMLESCSIANVYAGFQFEGEGSGLTSIMFGFLPQATRRNLIRYRSIETFPRKLLIILGHQARKG